MGGSLGCRRSIPTDPADFCQGRRKFSAACNFRHVQVKQERLDINTATEEELMTLPGVSRGVARNVVEYRRFIGGFRKVEDLALVSGIGAAKLEAVKPEICVSEHSPREARAHLLTGETAGDFRSGSPSASTNSSHEHAAEGPMHMASVRPRVEPFSGTRGGRAVLRVATWNLQCCSGEKASNPGVREVICMTLLENQIQLLAVQDLTDGEALEKLCAELNQPTLDSVRSWRKRQGPWKCVVSDVPTARTTQDYLGFLWDSSVVQLKDSVVLHSSPAPFLCRFCVGSAELSLLNFDVSAPAPPTGSDLTAPSLTSRVQQMLRDEKPLLLLGHVGGAPDFLRGEQVVAHLPPTAHTDISTRSPHGSRCQDNIWSSHALTGVFTGHCAVVREGLTNPWIPDSWRWGGVASEHCPVLAEVFVEVLLREHWSGGGAAVERDEVTSRHER